MKNLPYGMTAKRPPCDPQCPLRSAECHGTCKEYKEYREYIDEITNKKNLFINSHIPTGYYANQTMKRKK